MEEAAAIEVTATTSCDSEKTVIYVNNDINHNGSPREGSNDKGSNALAASTNARKAHNSKTTASAPRRKNADKPSPNINNEIINIGTKGGATVDVAATASDNNKNNNAVGVGLATSSGSARNPDPVAPATKTRNPDTAATAPTKIAPDATAKGATANSHEDFNAAAAPVTAATKQCPRDRLDVHVEKAIAAGQFCNLCKRKRRSAS